jgi:protein phosphatase
MILETASASHPGLVRRNNEDSLASRLPDNGDALDTKGALFGVADGVGGAAAGEVASREALEALVGEYYSPRAPHPVEQALRQAAQAANLRVFHLAHGPQPELRGMLTTLTALVLAGPQAYLTHVGDSRAYLLREGALTQLTGDHSEAAELLRLRLISPAQARAHPRRSVLTRTLGNHLLLRPDFSRLPVQGGDRFLLCTDGLWSELDDDTLRRVGQQAPAAACDELIELACRQGGSDNMTLQVIRVVEPGRAPAPATGGRLGRLLAGLRGG